jgi:hypothetical protein
VWIVVVAYEQFPLTIVVIFLFFESKLDDADKGWGEESLLDCEASVARGLTLHVGEGEGVGIPEAIAVVGVDGGLCGASLGPLYASAPGIHVT